MIMDKDTLHVLAQIRDLQQEHLAEYRRVTEESLALQRQAVSRQEQLGRLYRIAVSVAALLFIPLVAFLYWRLLG